MSKCHLCKKNVDTDDRGKQYYIVNGDNYCKPCGKVAIATLEKRGITDPAVSIIGWPKYIAGGKLKRVK